MTPRSMPRGRWSLRAWAESVPRLVWAATAMFAVLLAAWSVLLPLYEGPDEPNHVDLIMSVADGGAHPEYNTRQVAVAVMNDCFDRTYTQRWCPTPGRPTPAMHVRRDGSVAPDRGTDRTYDQLGGDAPTARPNQLAQHPPLYYRAMATVVQIERFVSPSDWSLAREVALLRLVNALLLVPLPLLAWAAARRLGLARRVASVAALLPLAIPQLTHIGSTVTNDTLLVLLSSVAVVLAAGVIRGDRSWPTAAGLAVVGSAAMLTKASGVGVLVLVGVAYAVGWWDRTPAERRAEWRSWAMRLVVVAGAVVVLAGWWYLRNRFRYGTFTPSIDSESIDERLQPPGFSPSIGTWSERFFAWMPARFFGWFGWFSARATFRLLVAASLAAGVLVAVGLGWPRTTDDEGDDRADGGDAGEGRASVRAASPARRLHLFALFSIGPVLLATVVVRAWGLYVKSGQFPFLQGRYLFPAIVAGAVVAAAGAFRLFGRWAATVVVAWSAVMQVDGIRTVLRTYWGTNESGVVDQVASVEAWSRWPVALLAAGTVLVVVAVVGVVLSLVADLRGRTASNP